VRFLERLLADWAPVDEVWEETGETALQMAIGYQDPDVSITTQSHDWQSLQPCRQYANQLLR